MGYSSKFSDGTVGSLPAAKLKIDRETFSKEFYVRSIIQLTETSVGLRKSRLSQV